MADFFATFHIEGRLLLAQFINFAVVFVLVYFCVLKPLSKLMKSRTQTIEKGLDDAKKAETELMMAGHEKERIITEGHQEAKNIVLSAQSSGEQIVEDAKVAAEAEGHKAKQAAIKEIETLREHQTEEIKAKSIDLVVSGVEAVLKKQIDASVAEKMIKDITK
jgi:F-type H+-transporting ATPase subunit b